MLVYGNIKYASLCYHSAGFYKPIDVHTNEYENNYKVEKLRKTKKKFLYEFRQQILRGKINFYFSHTLFEPTMERRRYYFNTTR